MAKKSSVPKPRTPRAAKPVDRRLDILWNRSERERLTAVLANTPEGSVEHTAIRDQILALGEPE